MYGSVSFNRVSVATALAGLIVAASARAGGLVVRDAPGGENGGGEKPGVFVEGTGGRVVRSFDGRYFGIGELGAFSLQVDFGNGWVPLVTFCVEPGQSLGLDLYEHNPNGLDGYSLIALAELPQFTALEREYLQKLWAAVYTEATDGTQRDARVRAAAFQALVWEMVLDDGLALDSLETGNYRLDTSDEFTARVVATAQGWIAALSGNAWQRRAVLQVLAHPHSQNMLYPTGEYIDPEPAPHPAGMAPPLCGFGIGMLMPLIAFGLVAQRSRRPSRVRLLSLTRGAV